MERGSRLPTRTMPFSEPAEPWHKMEVNSVSSEVSVCLCVVLSDVSCGFPLRGRCRMWRQGCSGAVDDVCVRG